MKLLVIISVDFDVINQLLIRYFAFIRYWRKMGVKWDCTSAIYRFQESL
jgi:hypothetical protein